MFDLRDDGSIAIDFETPGEGDTEATTTQIVVKAPPTFGAYKRIRAVVDDINKRRADQAKTLREDDAVTAVEMTAQLNSYTEDGALEWWKFVMIGDETFKGLASVTPPDQDSWPIYLVTNDSITQALVHWKSVPLARGGKLIPTT